MRNRAWIITANYANYANWRELRRTKTADFADHAVFPSAPLCVLICRSRPHAACALHVASCAACRRMPPPSPPESAFNCVHPGLIILMALGFLPEFRISWPRILICVHPCPSVVDPSPLLNSPASLTIRLFSPIFHLLSRVTAILALTPAPNCHACLPSVWSLSRIRTPTEGPSLLICHGCQGCLPY